MAGGLGYSAPKALTEEEAGTLGCDVVLLAWVLDSVATRRLAPLHYEYVLDASPDTEAVLNQEVSGQLSFHYSVSFFFHPRLLLSLSLFSFLSLASITLSRPPLFTCHAHVLSRALSLVFLSGG